MTIFRLSLNNPTYPENNMYRPVMSAYLYADIFAPKCENMTGFPLIFKLNRRNLCTSLIYQSVKHILNIHLNIETNKLPQDSFKRFCS